MATSDINVPVTLTTADAGSVLDRFADEIRALHGADIKTFNITDDGSALLAVLPKEKRVEDLTPILEKYLDLPRRRRGTATTGSLASFVALVNRFKAVDSAIFASPDRTTPALNAVLNYHPETDANDDANWGDHIVRYACPLSDEWKAWVGSNGKAMAQADFAAFIEERVQDVIITDPADTQLQGFAELVGGSFASPSKMVELSRGLQINVETVVKDAVTLQSGEIAVRYEEQHRDGAGQPLRVPNLFAIAIPVFMAGALYRVPVRLRYRMTGGRLSWSYHLVRAEQVFDHAYAEVQDTASANTDLPLFLGAPERAA